MTNIETTIIILSPVIGLLDVPVVFVSAVVSLALVLPTTTFSFVTIVPPA